jgi:hypothetical protein
VPAPIVGDYAKALIDEEKHLRIPIIRGERPAMAENDGLTLAPILVVDFDARSILFPNNYAWHGVFSFLLRFVEIKLMQTTSDK